MRCALLRAGSLLVGFTFASADVAAQTGEVTGGSIVASSEPDKFTISWTGTWQDTEGYDVVGVCAPVYGSQSPSPIYPDGSSSASSDGSDSSDVPDEIWLHSEEAYGQLEGAYVWYEYGQWEWSTLQSKYLWTKYGDLCQWQYFAVCGITCFAPGTPLLILEGSKPIEQFKAGDWILSSPQDAKAPAIARRVKGVIRKHAQLMDIAVAGQVIHATGEHPFYVKGRGWIPVASLVVGDLLRSHDDRWLPVESVVEGAKSAVYDVSVEGSGTYFVGGRDWGFSVWVYGACKPETPLKQLVQSKSLAGLPNADGGRPSTSWRRLLHDAANLNSKPIQRGPMIYTAGSARRGQLLSVD